MIKQIIFICLLVILTTKVSYSQSSIEFTVMHGPGGVSDITTRHLADVLGKNYSVINRPGGAGRIAINHMLSEKTIMLATMVQVYVTNTLNFKDLGHDPFKDFKILSVIGVMPSALVCNKKTNFKTYEDFLKADKKLTFGIGGYGTSEHLSTATLFLKTNSNHTIVAYPTGGNRSVADLIGGHIDCMFANFPTIRPLLENKNLMLLMTSHDLNYQVPSWNSLYKEPFPFQSYMSIITPRNISESMSNQLKLDVKNIVNPDFKNKLATIGLSPLLITDENEIEQIKKYMNTIKEFIMDNKIKTTN